MTNAILDLLRELSLTKYLPFIPFIGLIATSVWAFRSDRRAARAEASQRRADVRADAAETRADAAEARAIRGEELSIKADARADAAEARAVRAEDRSQKADARAEEATRERHRLEERKLAMEREFALERNRLETEKKVLLEEANELRRRSLALQTEAEEASAAREREAQDLAGLAREMVDRFVDGAQRSDSLGSSRRLQSIQLEQLAEMGVDASRVDAFVEHLRADVRVYGANVAQGALFFNFSALPAMLVGIVRSREDERASRRRSVPWLRAGLR